MTSQFPTVAFLDMKKTPYRTPLKEIAILGYTATLNY